MLLFQNVYLAKSICHNEEYVCLSIEKNNFKTRYTRQIES